MAALSRRALGCALAAVAPVALAAQCSTPAPAARLSPDAALLAACDDLIEAEARFDAFLRAHDTVEKEDAAEEEEGRLIEVVDALADAVLALPATTLPGMVAKARATLRIGPCRPDGTPAANDTSDALRVSVLQDLIHFAAGA